MKLNNKTFYSISLITNKRLNEIYSTWYHLPKNTLLNGHLLLINFQSTEHIDQRSIRLFYCRFGEGDQDSCTERRNWNIQEKFNSQQKFFWERIRNFVQIFPDKEKNIEKPKKVIKDLLLAYEKKLQLFEEKRKKKKKKKTDRGKRKKVFCQTYIL